MLDVEFSIQFKKKKNRQTLHLLNSKSLQVVLMSFRFWLLAVDSCGLCQAEEEITACKAKQILKMTTIYNQNGPRLSFWVNTVIILWICTASQTVISFSAWDKLQQPTAQN